MARLRPLMWLAALGAGVAREAAGPQPAPEEAAWVWEGLDATAVSVFSHDVCALDREGLASCIGDEASGITETPATPLRRVELGPYCACGLAYDETVVCWGCGYREMPEGPESLDEGQCAAPAGDYIDVTTTWWRSCAVAADSTAMCWGRPLENGAADAIAQGVLDLSYDTFLCAVGTGGQLECWDDPWDDPPQPPGGTFRRVEVGEYEACAQSTSGGLHCWGLGPEGEQLVIGDPVLDFDIDSRTICVIHQDDGTLDCVGGMADWPTPAGRYVDVAVGLDRAYAVREDGLLVGWGDFSPPDTGTVD